MTKQETIKEAYGQYYDDCMPDENGWFNIHNAKIKFKNYYLLENFDEEGNYRRPKSLSGIENNNGWVKIESEADLPKGITDCWFKTNQGNIILGYFTTRCFFVNEGNDIELKFVTHYQTIQKPKPPIY